MGGHVHQGFAKQSFESTHGKLSWLSLVHPQMPLSCQVLSFRKLSPIHTTPTNLVNAEEHVARRLHHVGLQISPRSGSPTT